MELKKGLQKIFAETILRRERKFTWNSEGQKEVRSTQESDSEDRGERKDGTDRGLAHPFSGKIFLSHPQKTMK